VKHHVHAARARVQHEQRALRPPALGPPALSFPALHGPGQPVRLARQRPAALRVQAHVGRRRRGRRRRRRRAAAAAAAAAAAGARPHSSDGARHGGRRAARPAGRPRARRAERRRRRRGRRRGREARGEVRQVGDHAHGLPEALQRARRPVRSRVGQAQRDRVLPVALARRRDLHHRAPEQVVPARARRRQRRAGQDEGLRGTTGREPKGVRHKCACGKGRLAALADGAASSSQARRSADSQTGAERT